MDKTQLARKIYQTAHLTGTFTLRSGKVSNEYFDKFLFEADPALLSDIAELMVLSIPAGTEVLAGLEMGGLPMATALSLKTGIHAAFVRKKAKEYGTCKLAEGAAVQGRRVCIVEDVFTTGGAIADGIRELRKLGAVVETVLCVIRRGDASAFEVEHQVTLIPAFTMEELLASAT